MGSDNFTDGREGKEREIDFHVNLMHDKTPDGINHRGFLPLN